MLVEYHSATLVAVIVGSVLTLFSRSRKYKTAATKYLPQCSRILGLASLSTRVSHHKARNCTEPRWPPAEVGRRYLSRCLKNRQCQQDWRHRLQQAGLGSPAAYAAQCPALSQLLGVSLVNTCPHLSLTWYNSYLIHVALENQELMT